MLVLWVERMFNYARDICYYQRGSLNELTISSLMMYICILNKSIEKYNRFTSELAGSSL